LNGLLERGGIKLRKWARDCPAILENVPLEHCFTQLPLHDQSNTAIKLMGVFWNATKESFFIQARNMEINRYVTKRQILSDIAHIYDPCGWLSPLMNVVMLLLQQLWKEQVSWDDKVLEELAAAWHSHRSSYEHLASYNILRYINTSRDPVIAYEIHGFCDSYEEAYGAIIYVVAKSDILTSTLMVSTIRVAILKKISIPRLELCSAVLLAQLIPKFNKWYQQPPGDM